MKRCFLFIALFFTILNLNAQYGPGGVGSNTSNGLWLRADALTLNDGDPVSSWSDASGNANDASQGIANLQPIFVASSPLNNQPSIQLDGNNDVLSVADAAILDGTSAITYFAVVRPSDLGQVEGILSKRISAGNNSNYSYAWFFWTGNRLFNDIHTNNNRYNSGGNTFADNTNYLLSFDFDGARAAALRSRMFSGGNLIAQSTENSTALPNSNRELLIGQLNGNNSSYFTGDIAEIIHYNYALNDVERIIVQNYLSAKYDIALAADDYYSQDDPVQGNYDHDVAGIGRSGSLEHNDAQGSGLLRINNPRDLDDEEFLLWGHDAAALSFSNSSDIPAGTDARLQRLWRSSEVLSSGGSANVGGIDLSWDLSAFSGINAADLQLLVDTDNDGLLGDEVAITGATDLGGNRFLFSNVTAITDNTRFTLASISNTPTILDVELGDFQVRATENRAALLRWETLNEERSDRFMVQVSADGQRWYDKGEIAAAGNSNEPQFYEFIDANPLEGWSYYRLEMWMRDGTIQYSPVRSFYQQQEDPLIKLYPNPSSSVLEVEAPPVSWESWQVIDALGVDYSNAVRILQQDEQKRSLDVSALPAGMYWLKTKYATRAFQKR